jgi:release factor glutamine methyltransferase
VNARLRGFDKLDHLPRFDPQPAILDIGTGSGAIAVALAKEIAGARVTAMDISRPALVIAARNTLKYNAKIEFVEADILSPVNVGQGKKYDIVVSNPPYIPAREKPEMVAHVVDHEPHGALFVPDDDPLRFYRAIANADLLCDGGELYFEIHENHAVAVCDLLNDSGFAQVETRLDINDKPRMVRCVKV